MMFDKCVKNSFFKSEDTIFSNFHIRTPKTLAKQALNVLIQRLYKTRYGNYAYDL